MDERITNVNEDEEIVEELVPVEEDEATAGESGFNSGSLVGGIVGGLLAYALVQGARKLKVFAVDKLAEWKWKKEAKKLKDDTNVEVIADENK